MQEFNVSLTDKPGELAQVASAVGDEGINILGSTQGTRAELEKGFYWMSQAKIKAIIDSVYTFENAVEAHNKMLNGKGLVGKIILKPE